MKNHINYKISNIIIFVLSGLLSGSLNTVSFAQVYSDTTWECLYFGTDIDEKPRSLKHLETYDRGYLLGTYYYNEDGIYKPRLMKTDINGNYLWDRVLDTILYSSIATMVENENGGILMAGSIEGENNRIPWVGSLNACMEMGWCRKFEWDEYCYATDMAIDHNGDIIVLTSYYGHSPSERINLIKLSPEGELIWKKNYATIEDHPYIWNAQGNQLIISESNDYYITGQAWWPTNNDPNQGSGLRSFFIKVAPNGHEEWVMPFGIYDGIYGDATKSIQINDTLFFALAFDWSSPNIKTLFLWYSDAGVIYQYQSGEYLTDEFYFCQIFDPILMDDNTLWGIMLSLYEEGDTQTHCGYIQLDTSFNVLNYMEDDRWKGRTSLIHTFNNKFITVAAMQEEEPDYNYDVYISKRNEDYSFDSVYTNWSGHYDTLCDHEIISGYLPYDCETVIVGMEEVESKEILKSKDLNIRIKPNPTQAIAVAEFENLWYKELEMHVVSLTGKEHKSQSAQAYPRSFSFNTQSYPVGMYFVVLRHHGKIVGTAKFVKD